MIAAVAAVAAMRAPAVSAAAPFHPPYPVQPEREGTIERRVPGATTAVVVLHGLYHHPGKVEQQTRLTPVGTRHGFDLVYPAGLGGSWNAGWCCGSSRDEQVDDVGYLASVVLRLRSRGIVRVYLAGFSNGGMMAYRYACAAGALAGVDGVLVAGATYEASDRCDYRGRVVHLHGLADRTVPYTGKPWSAFLGAPVRDSRTIPGLAPYAEVDLTPLPKVGHGWPALTNDTLVREFGLDRRL